MIQHLTRKQARVDNVTTYHGAPCKYGHQSGERYVRTGACVTCAKLLRPRRTPEINAAKRAWKAANPDKVRAERARYHERYGPEIAAREATALAHRRARRADRKRWIVLAAAMNDTTYQVERLIGKLRKKRERVELTRQQLTALRRATREARKRRDPEGHRQYERNKKRVRKARERRGGPRASKAERMVLLASQDYACNYCHATSHLELDHMTAVRNGGSNAITNLQYLCQPCNAAKASMSDDDYRAWAGLPVVL